MGGWTRRRDKAPTRYAAHFVFSIGKEGWRKRYLWRRSSSSQIGAGRTNIEHEHEHPISRGPLLCLALRYPIGVSLRVVSTPVVRLLVSVPSHAGVGVQAPNQGRIHTAL